jgi:hypothetical protein
MMSIHFSGFFRRLTLESVKSRHLLEYRLIELCSWISLIFSKSNIPASGQIPLLSVIVRMIDSRAYVPAD